MLSVCLFGLFITSVAGYSMCPMHVECIPGCVGLDERGCKTCACGPAMFVFGAGRYGMPSMGGGASFHPGTLGGGSSFGSIMGAGSGYHPVAKPKEKPLKECKGTMLCMMTCTGHYSLSDQIGSDGCRACTCPKEVSHTVVVPVKVETKPPTHPDCTGTKLCLLTCKGKAILGEHGKDGCQTCACVPETKIVPVPVEHKEPECHVTALCMSSCKHGYSLGAHSSSGCRECDCKPAPTPAPTPAPHRLECPDTLQCMLSCSNGYQLGSTRPDGCPTCSCLKEPGTVLIIKEVTCSQALSCRSGCTVGYKCDNNGCPTCECIRPEVVGVLTVTEVYTKKELTCSTALSCSKSCSGSVGYKCGTDGCPICECLVKVQTVTNVKPIQVQPKPQTSAVSTLVSKCHTTMSCMTSCDKGYTLGREDKDGCPVCSCIQPATTECHNVCEHKPAMTFHKCDKSVQCMASCTDGYELGAIGSDGCPSCTCKQPECHTGCTETHQQVIEVVQTTSGGSGGSSGGSSGGALMTSGGSGGGNAPFSAGGSGGGMTGGGDLCPPLPPNCHPYCIKYDVAHCRKCECASTGTGAYSG